MSRDLKVGLFVLAGLVMSAVVIFLIGDERRLFNPAVDFRTKFSDVQGLKSGAPIRMGGIDIGHVDFVGYGDDPKDTTVYVRLSIVKAESSRIKTDSVVKIVSKGLLGDKMLEITKGKAAAIVPPGGEIPGEEANDPFGKVAGLADKADAVMTNVEKATASLADDKLHDDLKQSVASLHIILDTVATGEGYPHKFLTDKNEAERISRTLDNLDRAAAEATRTMADTRDVVGRVKTGPGFAHDAVYGDGPKKQIEQFGSAAEEVAMTLKGVRESDSFAHDVLYGGKNGDKNGAEALANLTAMSADLRAIVHDVKQGKGTVGALLVDPSIYEDLKTILGNVQRNDVLRALVRYSIKQDEKKPTVEVGVTPSAP